MECIRCDREIKPDEKIMVNYDDYLETVYAHDSCLGWDDFSEHWVEVD